MHDPRRLHGITKHPRLVQYLGDIRLAQEPAP